MCVQHSTRTHTCKLEKLEEEDVQQNNKKPKTTAKSQPPKPRRRVDEPGTVEHLISCLTKLVNANQEDPNDNDWECGIDVEDAGSSSAGSGDGLGDS